MKLLRWPSLMVVALSFISALVAVRASAQNAANAEENDSTHEGDVREREAFFYERLTSSEIKDVAEIRRIAVASLSSMTRADAFREAQVPTWKSVGGSISNYASGRVRSIAFDPVQPNALYIAATVGGLWQTDDITAASVTWRCLSDNLPTSVCSAVAIPNGDANTIYLGTGETYPGYVASVGMGVFKSTDKGLNWKNVLSEKVMGLTCAQIAVDPMNANNVFVAAPGDYHSLVFSGTTTGVNGLFHSVDGGASWVNAGLPSGAVPVQVSIDPTNALRVYAAGFNGQVYRSTDGGYSWMTSSVPYEYTEGGANPVLAIAPSSPNILYLCVARPRYYTSGGIYSSADYGATWGLSNDCIGQTGSYDPAVLSVQGFYGNAIAVYETDPNSVYVGGLNIFGSADGGSSFAQYSNSNDYPDLPTFSHADIHALVAKNGKIYCGSDGGISIYENQRWNNLANKGLSTLQFINVDADEGLTRFVGGTQDNGTNLIHSNEPNWKTTHGGDGGNAWVSPVNPDVMYGTYTYTRIFRSDDGGLNWSDQNFALSGLVTNQSLLSERAPFYAAYDASPDGSVVAFGGNSHMYVSADGGADGFAREGQQSIGAATSVLVSPTNSKNMWAGVKNSIWRSKDMGLTWSRASVPVGGNVVGIINGANDNTLYAAIGGMSGDSNNHFVKSTDAGATWRSAATGFPSLPVNSIARNSSGQLFVGTDYGVITSTNDGKTWSPFGLGMPLVQVLSLKVKGSDPEYLLAGTHGRGAYLIPLTPLPVQQAVGQAGTSAFRLNDLSPNPAINSASANISFEMDYEQEGRIELYDALGRDVATIANERFTKGTHTLALPLATLASGDYFITLTSNGSTLSKKLVVAK